MTGTAARWTRWLTPGPCLQFTAAAAVCRVPGGFCPEAGRLAAARAQVAASVSIGKAVVSFAAHRYGEGLATNAAAFRAGSVCGRPGSGRTGGSADSALSGVDPAAIYGRPAHPVGRDSAVYRLVLSVIEIPAHLLPGNMDMKKLIFACDAILTGGDGDHQQSIL